MIEGVSENVVLGVLQVSHDVFDCLLMLRTRICVEVS